MPRIKFAERKFVKFNQGVLYEISEIKFSRRFGYGLFKLGKRGRHSCSGLFGRQTIG